MKRLQNKLALGLTVLALMLSARASAQSQAVQRVSASEGTACGLPVSGITLNHANNQMNIGMNLDLGSYELKGDRASIFVPILKNGNDSVALNPVGLYSRLRYIQYLREDGEAIGGAAETSYRYSKRPQTFEFAQTVPYQEWMNGASLSLERKDYGCCNTVLDECNSPLSAWKEVTYRPKFCYVDVAAEAVKTRELSGRAFIDFPVNRTEIHPDYRGNQRELAKIIATIDSVRNDEDVTIKRLHIKGFASPEGPYDNNIRLAKGRTESLKQYVQNLYQFQPGFITTDYEPEDWEGLREFVASSGMQEKENILAIIDSDLAPDPKNTKIQTTYPAAYKFLLTTVYPGLRHSDYTIEYTIRNFTDINKIAEIFETAPSKLSINELIKYANSLEQGSDKYNNVYETAASLYPTSDVANLNAANSAMQRGDMMSAERYLAKAGDSDAAVYARGVFAAIKGDYATALPLFNKAAATISQAAEAAAQINEINSNN